MIKLNTFSNLFKEYMYTGALDIVDQKIYGLIERYRNKVSKRLLKIQIKLLKKGKKRFTEMLREQINYPNTLLNRIEKDANWDGGCYHQPVILGLEHGVTFVSEDK